MNEELHHVEQAGEQPADNNKVERRCSEVDDDEIMKGETGEDI